MKKRKLIISMTMLLLVVIIGIIAYINKLPTRPLNESEIRKLLKKTENIENISIKTTEEIYGGYVNEMTLNKKSEVTRTVSKSKNNYTIAWKNSKTKEWIIVDENNKIWYKMSENEVEEEFDYRFIKYEEYNKSKCAVIETTVTGEHIGMNEKNTVNNTVRMWVDLKTGVALKIENKNDLGEESISYSTVTLNKVRDEDVAKPNLDGYTEYDINKDE